MEPVSKILIVEDNRGLNEILRKIVESEGYEAASAFTGTEALQMLTEDGPFDLILLDVMLPDPESPPGGGMDGFEVCQRVKSEPTLDDTMIFLVTVKDQPEDIMRGIDAGADDYITKPFNTTLLLAKIKAMLRIKNLSVELKKKNRLLEEMAITDGLTGIPNYRFFIEKLDEEVKRSRRYKTPFSLIILDLDNFKEINDNYGHRHGDYVLREVAARLQQGLRETDLLARYGGDEFAMLLTQTDLEGGKNVADQVLERLSVPITTDGFEHHILASIGLVYHDSRKEISGDDLIVAADNALYTAKEMGGDQIHISDVGKAD
ncbi:MAG: diguanylate cyclase [bacterium]|nr:diguanylate cyclase [bacterium]MDT8396792.1 diguanylate cyclase [bacterium]